LSGGSANAVMESGDISAAIEPYSKLLALRIELARTAPDEVAAQRGISNAEAHLAMFTFAASTRRKRSNTCARRL